MNPTINSNSSPRFAEKGFTVLSLFLLTGALLPLLQRESGTVYDPAQGDPLAQLIFGGIYAITYFLLLVRWKTVLRVVTSEKLLVLLVGLAALSVLWSDAPPITLRRALALLGTTLFGAYLAIRYSPGELLRLLAWALGLAAVLSLVFALLVPDYGISQQGHLSGWRGIYGHKNSLGRMMALGAPVFFLLALDSHRGRWALWTGFGLSVALVILSNSVTAWLMLLILAFLFIVQRAVRTHPLFAAPAFLLLFLLGVGILFGALLNADTLLSVLGRDTTLTGRTRMWAPLMDEVFKRPWFGHGYGAFWLGWEGESASVWRTVGWTPPHAHNGFFDLTLELGFVGFAVFSLHFLRGIRKAVLRVCSSKTTDAVWLLTYMMFIFVYNLTESSILARNSLLWALYTATLLSLRLSYAPKAEPSIASPPR